MREFADELLHFGIETCGTVSEPAAVVLNEVYDALVVRPRLLSRCKERRANAQDQARREAAYDLGAGTCQEIHETSIRERADGVGSVVSTRLARPDGASATLPAR